VYTIIKDDVACHDIVQDVFIKIFEKASFDNIDNIRPYLYRAVYNASLNYIRQEKKSEEKSAEYSYLTSTSECEEEVNEEKIKMILTEVLNELPDTCREVFLYAKQHNLKYKEIAEKMNISIKTVESHMSVAFKKIKLYLDKHKNWMAIIVLVFLSNYEY